MSEPQQPADPVIPESSDAPAASAAAAVPAVGHALPGDAVTPRWALATLADRPWFGAALWLLLVVVALLANRHALTSSPFLWTDRELIGDNSFLNALGGVQRIWAGIADPSTIRLTQYAPLAQTTFYVDRLIWGDFAGGFRVTSCLLHATCGLMAWYLLRRLAIPGAAVIAVLFVAHPTAVETVSLLTERRTILATLLGLAGTFLLLRAMGVIAPVPGKKPMLPEAPDRLYLLAGALFVVGFFAHGLTCLLPAAAMLLAWWRRKPLDSVAVGVCVGLMIAGAAMLGLNASVAHQRVPADPQSWKRAGSAAGDLAVRVEIAGRATAFYASKLALPLSLMSDYPRWTTPQDVALRLANLPPEDRTQTRVNAKPEIAPASPADWLAPAAVAIVLAGLGLASPRIGRGPFVSVACFVLCLLPLLGFIDLDWMYNSFVADRAVYLASLPFLAGFAALLAPLLARANQQTSAAWTVALLAFGCLAIDNSLSLRYSDDAVFWYAAGSSRLGNPQSTAAMMGFAQTRLELSPPDFKLADVLLEKARWARPSDPTVYLKIGDMHGMQGEARQAVASYSHVIEKFPGDARGPYRLATLYRFAADAKSTDPTLRGLALQSYARAIAVDPEDPDARAWYGATNYEFLARLPDNDPAIPEFVNRTAEAFDKAVQLDPYDPDRLVLMAKYLTAMGRFQEAGRFLRSAIQFDPSNPDIYEQIAEAAIRAKDLSGAEIAMRATIRLDPERASAYRKLGSLFQATGRFDEAERMLEMAVKLDPKDEDAATRLAQVKVKSRGTTQPSATAPTTPAATRETRDTIP